MHKQLNKILSKKIIFFIQGLVIDRTKYCCFIHLDVVVKYIDLMKFCVVLRAYLEKKMYFLKVSFTCGPMKKNDVSGWC